MEKKVYNSGIDIVKSCAVLFVVCVHFFLHSGFYYAPYDSVFMLFGACFRNVFLVCVPLFMLTTGYLQCKKTFSKKFFFGIFGVLSSYVFIGIISILFKIFCLKERGSLLKWIFTLTNFSADNYGWYVAMFLGLYLLIPFLNNAYHGCKDKKQKLVLIGVLFFISSVVCFNFSTFFDGTGYCFFNEYWCGLYLFLYYFIGAYIREYQPKFNKLFLFSAFIFCILAFSLISFFRYYEGTFPIDMFGEYNSVFTVMASVLFFLVFYDIDVKNRYLKKLLRSISSKTLEIYLFSYIFDTIFYTKLSPYVNNLSGWAKLSVPIVAGVFLLSYFSALLKGYLFKLFNKKALKIKTEENKIASTNV